MAALSGQHGAIDFLIFVHRGCGELQRGSTWTRGAHQRRGAGGLAGPVRRRRGGELLAFESGLSLRIGLRLLLRPRFRLRGHHQPRLLLLEALANFSLAHLLLEIINVLCDVTGFLLLLG